MGIIWEKIHAETKQKQIADDIISGMPSLKEYVLTLKKYNPNAEDRLLKIYLLKAGWPINEIERAFVEYNEAHTPAALAAAAAAAEAETAMRAAAAAEAARAATVAAAAEAEAIAIANANAKAALAAQNTVNIPVQQAPQAMPQSPMPAFILPGTDIEIAPQEVLPRIEPKTEQKIEPKIQPPRPLAQTPLVPVPTISAQPIAPIAPTAPVTPKNPEETYSAVLTPTVDMVYSAASRLNSPLPDVITPSTPVQMTASSPAMPPINVPPMDMEKMLGISKAVIQKPTNPSETPTYNGGNLIKTPTASSIDILTAMSEGRRTDIPGDPQYVMPAIERDLAMPHAQSTIGKSYASIMTEGGASGSQAGSNGPRRGEVGFVADLSNAKPEIDSVKDLAANPAKLVANLDGMSQSGGRGAMAAEALRNQDMARQGMAAAYDQSMTANSASAPSSSVMATGASVVPKAPAQVPSAAAPKKHTGRRIALGFTLVVLILGLAFGYMRYVHGVYLFVKEPVSRDDVLSYIVDSLRNIRTAEYSTKLTFKVAEREPGSEMLDLGSLGSYEDSMQSLTSASSSSSPRKVDAVDTSLDFLALLPSDTTIGIQVQALYQKEADNNDNRWHLIGDYVGEGVTAKVDLESIVKKDVVYVRLNTFPGMFFDIDKIKGKWISIDSTDQVLADTGFAWSSFFDRKKTPKTSKTTVVPNVSGGSASSTPNIAAPAGLSKEDRQRQIARLLEIANEEKVLTVVGDPKKIVQAEGKWYIPKKIQYEYEIRPDLTHFLSFIDKANRTLQAEFGSSSIMSLTEDEKKKMHDPQFAKIFDYFSNNGFIKMTVDKDRVLVGIDTGIKLVAKTKQAEIGLKVSFDNINDGVSVEAPHPDMSLIDAYALVTGQSKELINLKSQNRTVTEIRSIINDYALSHDKNTPESLDPSVLGDIELPRLAMATSTYTYKRVGKSGYQFTYQIALPPLPPEFYEMHMSLIGFDSASAFSTRNDKSLQYLKFVNGKNTATEKSLSIEADAAKRLDSDKDRVSNALEQYIGTNITKSDTDGDKVSDYDELQRGGNPNGAGSWAGAEK
jgi:hypothetical protein